MASKNVTFREAHLPLQPMQHRLAEHRTPICRQQTPLHGGNRERNSPANPPADSVGQHVAHGCSGAQRATIVGVQRSRADLAKDASPSLRTAPH
jgi:hypothetical protein